jgi:hypothetical protein
MRVLPWNTLLAWGRLGSISALLVNQPVVTSAIERSNMEEGKIAAWAQFGATERSPSMYIRMRVLPWSNTFVSVGVGINFSFW